MHKRLQKYRQQEARSSLEFYDVAPVPFLLARLWVVRSLNAYLEDTFYHNLEATVENFEKFNRLVAYHLRNPPEGITRGEFYKNLAYFALYTSWRSIYEDEMDIRHYGMHFDNQSFLVVQGFDLTNCRQEVFCGWEKIV